MNAPIEAFPLQWPLGHPHTEKRRHSLFQSTMTKARDELINQLKLWKAENVIISSNIPVRKDGLPYGRYSEPEDPGVAVYFTLKGEQRAIPCDEYLTVAENMRALMYVVEAMRTIERHGGPQLFNTAFAGFKALPAATGENWWEVLGVASSANAWQIREAFRAKAKTAHPDNGGSDQEMDRLIKARELGLATLRVN